MKFLIGIISTWGAVSTVFTKGIKPLIQNWWTFVKRLYVDIDAYKPLLFIQGQIFLHQLHFVGKINHEDGLSLSQIFWNRELKLQKTSLLKP